MFCGSERQGSWQGCIFSVLLCTTNKRADPYAIGPTTPAAAVVTRDSPCAKLSRHYQCLAALLPPPANNPDHSTRPHVGRGNTQKSSPAERGVMGLEGVLHCVPISLKTHTCTYLFAVLCSLHTQVAEGRWSPPSVVESMKKSAASVLGSAKSGAAAAAGAAKGAAARGT